MHVHDSESKRMVNRIKAIMLKQAKDDGAEFITIMYVAEKLDRNETFVKDNRNKNPYDCQINKKRIGRDGGVLNEHEKRVTQLSAGRQQKSTKKLASELSARKNAGNTPLHMTVF